MANPIRNEFGNIFTYWGIVQIILLIFSNLKTLLRQMWTQGSSWNESDVKCAKNFRFTTFDDPEFLK